MNNLVTCVEQANLSSVEQQTLLEKFSSFFIKAEEWEKKAREIVVTSEEQESEMKMARIARLELKNIRVDVEKTRKELKEESLRKGQTIDAIAKIIKNTIEPIEDYLLQQENFVQIQEEKRLNERFENRVKQLAPYEYDATINIRSMSDKDFNNYVQLLEVARQQKIEEEKLEEERKKKEEAERVAMVQENERLRLEAVAREKALEKERAERESERLAQQKILEQEKAAREKAEVALKTAKTTCPNCGHTF